MAAKWSFEQFATSIARMDKAELKQQIKTFPGRFRLDFTEDYLNTAPVDRLRHILLAAMINANSGSN
jgi:hypothetical protein